MKSLPNIEKSGFHRGEYVGYAHGVWNIRKSGAEWIATQRPFVRPAIRTKTLAEMSTRLEAVAALPVRFPAVGAIAQ